MPLRIAFGITVVLIVFIVIMAAFAQLAPEGSSLQEFGQSLFDFLNRVTPGS